MPLSTQHPDVLVGLETSDDAGVYRLTDELALVQTVDYFTPVVDDPYMFGQIAAANALSDVYAMGGTPITVLNLVGYPIKKLGPDMLVDMLRGANDKVAEANATTVGGHSIDDQEPKFGLAVTGIVHPERVLTNAGAKPGDQLILSKPIGIGILTTAIKRDLLTDDELHLLMNVMATLNQTTAAIMKQYNVHACTDVTGFGLLGHLSEMAKASQVGMTVWHQNVPVLPRTREFAAQGVVPGGSHANRRWLSHHVTYAGHIDETTQIILCDAVTSGGLLISLEPGEAQSLLDELKTNGVAAAIIGEVKEQSPGCIHVV